jgi:uncharacterized protein (DUF302 family)
MGESKTPYGVRATVKLPFDEAVERTIALLQAEGFGVLTRIDVQRTLQEKLGAEFRRYVILGACNPGLAHRAFQAELDIGLLLPCNVAVYETEGGAVVSFVDPDAMMRATGNEALRSVATEAGDRLARVRARLAG